MLVKVLGLIDLMAALAFLMMIFGFDVFTLYLTGCALLLFLKGLFIFTGDVLSLIDLYASLILLVATIFNPFLILMWIGAFLLLAKGLVSFL